MNNEELKKKIVEIIRQTGYGYFITHDEVDAENALEQTADALIAAGGGDVAETEHRAKVAEREAIILSKWLADKTRKNYPYQAWLEAAQKQAEKELAELKGGKE